MKQSVRDLTACHVASEQLAVASAVNCQNGREVCISLVHHVIDEIDHYVVHDCEARSQSSLRASNLSFCCCNSHWILQDAISSDQCPARAVETLFLAKAIQLLKSKASM